VHVACPLFVSCLKYDLNVSQFRNLAKIHPVGVVRRGRTDMTRPVVVIRFANAPKRLKWQSHAVNLNDTSNSVEILVGNYRMKMRRSMHTNNRRCACSVQVDVLTLCEMRNVFRLFFWYVSAPFGCLTERSGPFTAAFDAVNLYPTNVENWASS
jgi:hypothetical protein